MDSAQGLDTCARDLMHEGCTCIPWSATLVEAARLMADQGVGSLPICGPEERLIGMLTDRDIVVNGLAEGHDPHQCFVGELATGRVVWASDDTPAWQLLQLMETHLVHRVPIIDSQRQLVGIVALSDIATHLGRGEAGELVEIISAARPMQEAR